MAKKSDEEADIDVVLDDADTTNAKPDDIVIEKVDDAPVVETKTNEATEEALQKLKDQLESEKQARTAAERKANERAQDVHKAKSETLDANLTLVTNAIETVKQSNEILKANYRDAMSRQDFDAVSELQMEMSTNAAKLMQLEQGKQALETSPREDAPKPYAADPVEELAAQLSPRSAAWIRAHPDYATDQTKFQRMLAAHNFVTTSGIAPDTDAYFESIENMLMPARSVLTDDDDDASSAAAQTTQRRVSPPAAPVSRSASPGSPTQPNRVKLSAMEREMASNMGMTDQEYAKNKLALIKEGKLH